MQNNVYRKIAFIKKINSQIKKNLHLYAEIGMNAFSGRMHRKLLKMIHFGGSNQGFRVESNFHFPFYTFFIHLENSAKPHIVLFEEFSLFLLDSSWLGHHFPWLLPLLFVPFHHFFRFFLQRLPSKFPPVLRPAFLKRFPKSIINLKT